MPTSRAGSVLIPPRDVITCAFCQGRGVDPFNVMSSRSTCSSCHGRGVVSVADPHVECAYCSGSGSHKTFRCPVCEGAGAIHALEPPTRICLECSRRAADGSSGLVCMTCKGRGVVPD